MQTFFRIFIFLLVIVTTLSCEQNRTNTIDKENVRKEVNAYLNEYLDVIREEGLAAEFRYLDTTNRFFWVPPGFNQYIDIDSVKKIVMERADFYQLVDNRWEYLMVDVLTKEHAFYTGKLNCLWIDSTGLENRYKMLETGLVIKTTDGWKITGGQSRIAQ